MIRKFLVQILLFAAPMVVLFAIGLCMPPTPYRASTLIFGQIRKDSLLRHTPSPRIIFVGGSNISFGLDSRVIKDSLDLNPINTGLHAGLGHKYMMNHTLPFVKAGDVVVIIPEYSQYYGENYNGDVELVYMLIEVNKEWQSLRPQQLQYLPQIAFSRFDPRLYRPNRSPGYTVNSFNQYGDTYLHWDQPPKPITVKAITGKEQRINPAAIREIQNFQDSLTARGARMFVSYPCFMESSFHHNEAAIRLVESALNAAGFHILGTPDRYMMPDSLMFDTQYHLTKQGVDLRTQLLIEDLKFLKE